MERRKFIRTAVVGTGALFMTPFFAGSSEAKQGALIGKGQRYLFLDDHWINVQSGVTRSFHAGRKDDTNPVITAGDCGSGIGPYIFHWGSKQSPYSAWYGSFEEDTGNYPTSFVTSGDGINWTGACRETDAIKLGNGNKQCAAHLLNGSSLYDGYPYLCATGFRHAPDYNKFHWRFRRSRDGVSWEVFPGDPLWDGPSDVMQLQWDEHKKKFVAYYKVWRYKGVTLDGEPFVAYGHLDTKVEGNEFHIKGETYLPKQTIDVRLQYGGDASNDGGGAPTDTKMQMHRVVAYAESTDFLHWENEQIIIEPPTDAPLGDQSYGMPVTCYGNMYIGMYHHFNSLTGLIQPMMAWSYDGIHFSVHDKQFFLHSGKPGEWDYGMVLPSEFMDAGNGQLYLFYGSLAGDHLGGQYHGAFGRAWIRQDGFASLKGGRMETVPLRVQAKRMNINMTGEIGLSLKNASGKTIGKKVVMRGDHHCLVPAIDLSAQIDKEVVVHLDLSRGELFSITI